MGTMAIIDQAMGRITRAIEAGAVQDAVEQWRLLASSLGKCNLFCGPTPDNSIQTCGACLIAKLVGEANARSSDQESNQRYIILARDLQALLEAQHAPDGD